MDSYGVARELRQVAQFVRSTKKCLAVLSASCAFLLAAAPMRAAEDGGVGSIGGITRDASSGKPIAEARVVAHNLATNADKSTVTTEDGIFTFTNLEPGQYEIAATKNGFQTSSARAEVTARRTARFDLTLAADVAGVSAQRNGTPFVDNEKKLLLDRLERLEARLAAMEALNAPAKPSGMSLARGNESLVASTIPMAALPARPEPLAAAAPTPQPASAPQAAIPRIPEALEAPESTPGVDSFTPFAYGDFTWLNGSPRTKDVVLDTKFFTPEVRFDTHFIEDFNQPRDHSMGGSTEEFRSGEVQIEQISVGGDFHWQNVRGRILTMFGMFGVTTPRNDPSVGNGQWDLRGAYRYVSEAYGGYHFNVNHGLNVDAGIFVSYIGLFSYYNFDNWAYQPSYVSSNTPWFFNGVRIQWFPTNKLKIEPWIINGWQAYARANGHHGFGGQILWMPKEWLKVVFNNYGNGSDTLGVPNRVRLHTDDSVEVRYFNHPDSTGISKMAFSVTGDAGCEYGGGVTCHGGKGGPKQQFLGFMAYNRIWFKKDLFAVTVGGGRMNNPGRYLTLLPPINGADAVSGSPYFTENPGDKAHMWDVNINLQWMPKQYITWWIETGYRHSDVPYFTGRGGITPPGGNTGAPSQYACASGGSAGTADLSQAYINCGGPGGVWFPDLHRGQATLGVGVLVKF